MNNLCRLSETWGVLLGRVCIAIIFLQSGIDKLGGFNDQVQKGQHDAA